MQREGRLLNVRRILNWVAGYLSSSSWFLEVSLPTLPTPSHTVFPPAKTRRRTRSVKEIKKGALAEAVKGGAGRIQRLCGIEREEKVSLHRLRAPGWV